jgi:hypothetical protein
MATACSSTFGWDYRNRMTQSVVNDTTTSYLYDIKDERIAEGANGATTTYPFTFYNVATSGGGAAMIHEAHLWRGLTTRTTPKGA